MKVAINLSEKIQDKPFGSFGAACTIELDIDQDMLARPADVLAQIRFAADVARAAVDRELDLQRRKTPASAPAPEREPDARPSSRNYGRDYRGDDRRRPATDDQTPRTGRQLFGFAKDRDAIAWFTSWGKHRRYPARLNDWNEDEVSEAVREFLIKRGPASVSASSNGRH